MTDLNTFLEDFFQHAEYDPVKAREYYLKNRKLKGRQKGTGTVDNPESKMGFDGNPVNPAIQRVAIAQSKLNRARQLASKVRGAKGAAIKKRLDAAQAKLDVTKNKLPKRLEEDQVPMVSRSGAKLLAYGSNQATYSDGSTFSLKGWTAANKDNATRAIAARAAQDNAMKSKPVSKTKSRAQ